MKMRATAILAAIGAMLLMLAGVQQATAAKAPKTVEISGKAFIFNFMDTPIPGATIKVREFPKLSAVTDQNGDYALRVPNDANVTPYIVPGGPVDLTRSNKDGSFKGTLASTHWNTVDLQTFHTRSEDIENANFQTPRDQEYNALKAILQVPSSEDGRPEQCVIVTTASARDVRDVDFLTYWENTPHGVEGATSTGFPNLPAPTYFNASVIPDVNQPYSSHDGGIIWPVVPTGNYRIVTSHPDTKFASFLATCKPGRIVNANPPMGAYQLDPGEKPRTFSNVAAKLASVKPVRKTRTGRVLSVVLNSGEAINATVKVRAGSKTITRKPRLSSGNRRLSFAFGARIKARQVRVAVKLKDASGVSFTTVKKTALPKVIKKKRKPGKRK